MPLISLIAAVDEDYGLGKDNRLLCHLPADLKHFKTLTISKPIIMGRNTYEAIGKILPGRLNIILSKTKQVIKNASVVNNLQQAFASAANAPEIMVIGGASVYEQALPYASRIYLTLIHHHFSADVVFPQLDRSIWQCKEEHFRESDTANPYPMTFCIYERVTLS